MTNPFRRAWRAMWFKDDDDNTPQGKLARGCFYVFYWIIGTMIILIAIVGTTKGFFCGIGCMP